MRRRPPKRVRDATRKAAEEQQQEQDQGDNAPVKQSDQPDES